MEYMAYSLISAGAIFRDLHACPPSYSMIPVYTSGGPHTAVVSNCCSLFLAMCGQPVHSSSVHFISYSTWPFNVRVTSGCLPIVTVFLRSPAYHAVCAPTAHFLPDREGGASEKQRWLCGAVRVLSRLRFLLCIWSHALLYSPLRLLTLDFLFVN